MFIYLDDIVIYATSLCEYKIKFNKLIERFRKADLHLQSDKYEFLRKEITYLRYIINENGIKSNPKKIQTVKEFP